MAQYNGLKELINKSDYNPSQIAAKLGYTKSVVYSWTYGVNEPCARDMISLAKLLNVDVEVIVRIFGE